MTELFNERFHLRITLKQMGTLLYKHGLRNGIGSFRPGHVPANKGKTHPGRQGNYKPVGSERIENGYVVIKFSDRKTGVIKTGDTSITSFGKRPTGRFPGAILLFLPTGTSGILPRVTCYWSPGPNTR
jgi:hypothetical protein